jgi:putative ABC transport system substrate-binding protein
MNNKKFFGLILGAFLFALWFPAEAQQSGQVPRIGAYMTGSSKLGPREEAFRQGLRDFGYVEGRNILVEWRFAEKEADQSTRILAELVQQNVSIIVTDGNRATSVAKNATKTIPIVMAVSGDPLGARLIESLSRPGGNITGLTLLSPELSGKRLEILKEVAQKVTRVAVLGNPENPGTAVYLKGLEAAAKSLGLQLQTLKASRPNELANALSQTSKGRAHALTTLPDAMFFSERAQIVGLTTKLGLPSIFPEREFVENGGFMSYGPNLLDLFRRAATYVDKILKGAKPADLPVEQPTKFEFVINLKTAKQVGLTIPPNVLARADKVIK